MAFRVKDLMIKVVSGGDNGDPECSCGVATKIAPEAAPCGGTLCSCTVETREIAFNQNCEEASLPQCSCGVATAAATPPPGAITTVATITTITTITAMVAGGQVPGLKELMEQLRRVLEGIEKPDPIQGLPKTAEEAADLERRLGEAMQELQAHRKSLEKPATPPRKASKGKKK